MLEATQLAVTPQAGGIELELAVQPDRPAQSAPVSAPERTKERRITAALLGALGIAATIAEYHGMMKGWPEPLTALRDSGRHPLVGYVGAAIASRHPKLNNVAGLFLAGTGADIGTEAAQAFLLSGPAHTLDFVAHSQIAGNIQDYFFAIGGSTLWTIRNRGAAPPFTVAEPHAAVTSSAVA